MGPGIVALLLLSTGAAPGAPAQAPPAPAAPAEVRPAPGAAPHVADDDGPPLVEELNVEAPSGLRGAAARADGLTVQAVEREELESAGVRTVQEALQLLPGVHLGDEQGNAFQQDLTWRGFSASPLTGVSQGLSIFLDGVRINEPLAEEANFDLVPLSEVERIELIRGPAAAFGRNTLGGAVNIVTRRGGARTEAEAELEAGSFGRREGYARVAGLVGPLDGYLSAGGFTERGWRVDGGGHGARAFGKLGWRGAVTDLSLSWQVQGDRLRQAGSLPPELLAVDRRTNFTTGDFFRPTLHLLVLNGSRALTPGLNLTGNAFLRLLDTRQFNASFIAPDTRMLDRTRSFGAVLQLEHRARLGPLQHRLTAGAEATRNAVRVRVHQEPNDRNPTADDGSPLPRLLSELADRQLALGGWLQEGLRGSAGLSATASLRWDRIAHDIQDTSPVNPGGATGQGAYHSVAPAAGLAWAFLPSWQATASWSAGFRAPAFLELTCADATAPCVGLQAGVAPDATFTALKAVRSRALEAGLQGSLLPGLTATLDLFRIDLEHDIYSVAPAGTTSVYFQNVGRTRREGLEASLRLRRRAVDVDAGWAWTRATFQDDVAIATPRTDAAAQDVRRGATLPLTPRHRLDLLGRWRPAPWLSLEAGARYTSEQHRRGDEANLGPTLPGYLVARAGLEVRLGEWTASLRVLNLLDRRYQTFGTWAPDGRLPGQPVVPFDTPAPPLRLVAGLRWELG